MEPACCAVSFLKTLSAAEILAFQSGVGELDFAPYTGA